jgi:hypothetical protein
MTRHVFLAAVAVVLCMAASSPSDAQPDFSDADYLAAELSDSLLAPDSLVARLDHDLQLIRLHTPAVEGIHHSCQRLHLGAVGFTFSYGAEILFLAGQHEGLNELHARIGSPQVWHGSGYYRVFYYAYPYNPFRLAELHVGLVGLSHIDPVSSCIGDGPDILLRPEGTYLFRNAWGEYCTEGACEYSHTWIFRVDNEVVTLLQEYGDPVPVQQVTWGTVKALFR